MDCDGFRCVFVCVRGRERDRVKTDRQRSHPCFPSHAIHHTPHPLAYDIIYVGYVICRPYP